MVLDETKKPVTVNPILKITPDAKLDETQLIVKR
jgi:hypothetical protein